MAKTALVVDNDFFFVEFLSELLEQRGYEVQKAYDGKEGISKLEQSGAVDILFVDMIMPKIDGRQFIEYTRDRYPEGPFPIIAHSGTIIEQMDQLKEIGADYFIVKGPLDKMTDQINMLLDRVEQNTLDSSPEMELFEPENIYPRQDTAKLIDMVNYHRAITDCIGVGVIIVDFDLSIISANGLLLEMLDKSLADILGKPVLAIFAKEDRPGIANALRRLLQKQELKRVRFAVGIDSQKAVFIVSLLKVEGRVSGYVFVMEATAQWAEQA